jgi:hypothetical protein
VVLSGNQALDPAGTLPAVVFPKPQKGDAPDPKKLSRDLNFPSAAILMR